ncbi:Sodium-driven chloride bicarbonate exchanger [Liparis tanakae]|uniref:Sodium-driven chloride bicarbonate exchanger n=1 Tax=Liparis tanakae TaxID=230148 RepID=A0A4Z2J3N5_9TELE|nr:Sodium-driven chloride bicarbonate exchanger [Liparis tanakae]
MLICVCSVFATIRVQQRNDDEAVVDRGGTRSQQGTNFGQEDLEGHRTLYIGVHVPLGSTRHRSHRRSHHHGNKHRKRSKDRSPTLVEGNTPSQRVQFLLGTEDDDEEHIPHDLFTEMDEICVRDGENPEWRESARWLKFEEDVEDGGERWSKPYVATLSLHSLFELRSCIINSTELQSPLGDDLRNRVRETLLKRHHHQNHKKLANRLPIVRSIADMGRRASELHLDKNGQMTASQSHLAGPDGKGDFSRENSSVDFSKIDLHFMKKIPTGAEACNVLVGELESLNKPVVAFVRLSPAVLLSGLAEVPIATRFLFILLGPLGRAPQYHEIGRSIATLMTDEIGQMNVVKKGDVELCQGLNLISWGARSFQVFHDVAYKAKDRNDLIAGIDEFLDQVTVLPPGEWDPSIRIEPPKNVPSQEKRKKSNILPNGLIEGDEKEEEGGHAGKELQRTGRWFGGLFLDIKRKAPHYLSDYTDAFSLQCVASFLFLYCACMSPVITFGGLLGEATEGRIVNHTPFPLNVHSVLPKEAFASLICIIFIYEALEKLVHLGDHYPFNKNNNLDKLTTYSCSCVEPSDPTNATLKYWERTNVTASEIYWEALETKVLEYIRLH